MSSRPATATRRRRRGEPSAPIAWTVLTAWGGVWGLLLAGRGGASWQHFSTGGIALITRGDPGASLHVYASRADLRFGPVSMMAADLLRAVAGTGSVVLALLLSAAAGVAVLAVVDAVSASTRPLGSAGRRHRAVLLCGLAFLPVWMSLAVRSVHVDDVLALTLTCVSVLAAVHRRPVAAGVLLGLAVASKPWALPLLALALAVPAPARRKVLLAAVGTSVAAWMPFVLADPVTLVAARLQIPTAPSSSLPVVGLGDLATPWWDRPGQMLLGLAAAIVLVRRGRWPAVVLVVVGIQVALDPGVYSYYAAGILAGAALWDLVGSRARLPWWSWAAAASLLAARGLPLTEPLTGLLRLGCAAACLAALAAPRRRGERAGRRTILRYPEHPAARPPAAAVLAGAAQADPRVGAPG
jgi:hypothetical protein